MPEKRMPRIEWTTAGHAMDGDTPRIESIKKWSEGRPEMERRGIQKWTEAEMRKRALGAGLERT